MRVNEMYRNLHSEILTYLEGKSDIEDKQDMARYLAQWLRIEGFTPTRWDTGYTGLGTFMYVTTFMDGDTEKYLAFDDEAGVADITDNKPDPASYS
jgi:hypothetical protein